MNLNCGFISLVLFIALMGSFNSTHAMGGPTSFYTSPSFRVRFDATRPDAKPEQDLEALCEFDLYTQVLESDDTVGVRIVLRNRAKQVLEMSILPLGQLLEWDAHPLQPGLRGSIQAGETLSLLWGFEALKQQVLSETLLQFEVVAKEVGGTRLCRREVSLHRIRDGIVNSFDPWMMGLSLGSTVSRQGALAQLGGQGQGAWGLEVGKYSEKWGMVLAFTFEDFGGGGAMIRNQMRAQFPSWQEPTIRMYNVGFMASYRKSNSNQLQFVYDLGLLLRAFQYGDDKESRLTESRYALGFQHRLSLFYPIKSWRHHVLDRSIWLLGGTLVHSGTGEVEVLGQDVSGQSVSGLLNLRYSF